MGSIGANSNASDREFIQRLKERSTPQLRMDLKNPDGIYTRKDLNYIRQEIESRGNENTNTSMQWDADIQNWFDAQLRAARAGGAGVDAMVGIEANLRDQANRRQRDRRKK